MKKILVFLLTLALLFSLAACGGGDDDKTPSSDDKTQSSSQQQQQNATDPDPAPDKPDNSAGNISISTASIDGYDLPEVALAYVGTFNKAYNDLYNDGEITFYVKSTNADEDAFDALVDYYASNGGILDEGASTSTTKCFDFSWGRIEAAHFGADEEISAYIILPEYPVADNGGGEQSQQGSDPIDLSGYLGTKTGKFYSQFADGRMYMEYEMEMEGQTMTMISATDGDRTYSETKMGGISAGVSIMDGENMYTIDHASKIVIKMSIGANAQTAAGAVIEESDVDMGDLKTGTREIDGKTYDTEEWIVEGAVSIMCFDGDDLVYMIGAFDGEEMVMKILEVSDNVDDSLFEIPEDYTMMEL